MLPSHFQKLTYSFLKTTLKRRHLKITELRADNEVELHLMEARWIFFCFKGLLLIIVVGVKENRETAYHLKTIVTVHSSLNSTLSKKF